MERTKTTLHLYSIKTDQDHMGVTIEYCDPFGQRKTFRGALCTYGEMLEADRGLDLGNEGTHLVVYFVKMGDD